MLWPLMRGILADPRWATDHYDDVHNFLNRADSAKELTGKSLAAASYLHPGAQAASIASGAYGAASLVGHLPAAINALPGLSRIARWLGGSGASTGTIELAAAGPGGPRFIVLAASTVRVTPIVLTDAEVSALVASGSISATAAQLYMVASGGGGAAVGGEPSGEPLPRRKTNKENAAALRRNMKAKGATFNKGDAAHHICPSIHPKADLARKILDAVGIDINDAENGVALDWPTHNQTGLHTKSGVQSVVDRLTPVAGNKEDVIAELKAIAEEIRAGKFPPKGP